jgi:IS4 transposase
MFEMESREIQFIFRCKTSFNNQVSKFYLSNKKQETIIIKPAQNNSIKGLPYDKNATIKVRMIKIELPTGEIELLMTSLKDIEKYPYKYFKELYFKRWGIETFYNRFKNIIGVEQFSGKSEQFILQEFNCALYISNLQSLLTKEVQQEIEQKYADRKYEYKVNSSMSLSIIRSKMLALFTDQKNNQETLNQLKELFVKNVIPIRPDRNFERKTDKYRSRTKPKQFSNRRTVL